MNISKKNVIRYGIVALVVIVAIILLCVSSTPIGGTTVSAPGIETIATTVTTTLVENTVATTEKVLETKKKTETTTYTMVATTTPTLATSTTTTVEQTRLQTLATTSTTTTTTTTTIVTEPIETYVVYKPATHYIHMNTCRWAASGEVQRIENTEGIEARRCSECNPSMEIITEYVEPVPEVTEPTGSMSYVKHFTRGTYYAYGGPRKGGSQCQLIDCSIGDGTVKGSIASSYLYRNYGYNYNGKRTMIYLEIEGYSQMNGYYYLDDCDAGNPNVIDFFFLYGSNCPFQRQGVVQVDCYIVNY